MKSQWLEFTEKKSQIYPETKECFSAHMGLWLIEQSYMRQALFLATNGLPLRMERGNTVDILDGIAYVPIVGPITKAVSKFGGTSSVLTKRNIDLISRDDNVKGLFLHVDSPGGQAAGTQALSDTVREAAEIMPVHAHIEDLGASAALWASVRAHHISANPTAMVGSIGTRVTLLDSSGQFEREGIKAIDISTGPFKASGADGLPITDEHIAYWQGIVNDINSHFLSAVQQGREFTDTELEAVNDGRVFIAEKAMEFGLIDSVQSIEESFRDLQQVVGE